MAMRWCVDQAELLANDPQSITHLQDRERDRELTQQALSGEIQRYAVEKRYFHRSGRIVWVQLSVALVRDSDNNPRYFVGHIQDLSQQREMDRLKSEFVSMVSHELRTPLTSIVGSLGLVLGTTATDLPPNTRSLLDIAYSNTERLRRLIDDILDIDKITSGNMRFDLRPQSLGELTSKAVELNQGYAQRLKARIELDPVDPNWRIEVDEDRFIQVLSNLLSNAAKFSPPAGTIRVRCQLESGRARVCVVDQGPGIPEEFQDPDFRPILAGGNFGRSPRWRHRLRSAHRSTDGRADGGAHRVYDGAGSGNDLLG